MGKITPDTQRLLNNGYGWKVQKTKETLQRTFFRYRIVANSC